MVIYRTGKGNKLCLSISLYLHHFHCPEGIHIMYAHPQSCSETKGQRDIERKRLLERKDTEEAEKRETRRDRQVRVQFTVRGSSHFCCIKYNISSFVFYSLFSINPTQKLLLTFKYNNNHCGNIPVGF